MGTAFRQPVIESPDLRSDLARLKADWGFEFAATVLAANAQPLSKSSRSNRFGLLFGNEAQGLSRNWIAACDRSITIPMSADADSLNVAVAAGIFLNHFTREA